MIYRKEWNLRSPLRVFENSIHGGLGKGNLGVVMARAGIGKTAFLIGVALDDLLRARKVMHVSLGDSVEHVRAFYDEIFEDLRRTSHMEDAPAAHLQMERCRMIHTYGAERFSIEKLRRSVRFQKEHAHFEPEVILIDGFDVAGSTEADWTMLKEFAKELDVELWLTALTHREEPVTNSRGIPNPVARFEAWISVMVALQPEGSAVTVRLLKDHDNEDVTDLHMKLDPTTLLLLTEE
jgi:KaiC/GvpD/RAD55 family RecA-like ATPase